MLNSLYNNVVVFLSVNKVLPEYAVLVFLFFFIFFKFDF